jgi:hypothetical protein
MSLDTVPIQVQKRKRDVDDVPFRPVRARRAGEYAAPTLPVMAMTCLADSVPWRDRCAFVSQFKALLQNPVLIMNNGALSRATANLIRRHMVNLNRSNVSDTRLYHDASMNLGLINILGHGTFGEVWSGWLEQHGATQPVIIKLVRGEDNRLKVDVTDQFMNELVMQALLHCVANGLRMVPNPIPAVLAPVMLHDNQLHGSPGVVMDHAGHTLRQFIQHANETPANFWVILALVAHYLRELQQAVNFQHADLHSGNIMVGRRAIPITTWIKMPRPGSGFPVWNGDKFSVTTPWTVSIIDFGFACMTLASSSGVPVQLRTLIGPPGLQQCWDQSNSSDLFVLLSSIYYMLATPGEAPVRVSASYQSVTRALEQFLGNALTASGFDGGAPTHLLHHPHAAYFLTRGITSTTPDDVLALCFGQLQAAMAPQTGAP